MIIIRERKRETKKKRKKKEGIKGRIGGEKLFVEKRTLKYRLHSEPSERGARTTCERPVGEKFGPTGQTPIADPARNRKF